MFISQFNPLKCLMHSQQMQQVARGEIPPPIALNLDLTNKCNYNCTWCYVSSYIKSKPIEMPIETALSIIEGAACIGVKSVLFTGGGEPTLYPQFLTAVEAAADFNLDIGLTTNGSKLNELKSKLPYDRFKYIRISFDAGTEKTYNKVHGCKKYFQQILHSASYIANHIGAHCQLGMAFLATPFNYKEIPQALKLAEECGFTYLSIRPAVFKTMLSDSQIEEAVDICNNLNSGTVKIMPLKSRFASLKERKIFECRSTPLIAIVTADAKFNLCCQHRGKSEYQWGDLEADDFEILWGNQEHQNLINEIDVNKCPLCRMITYNEIIEEVFIKDKMHYNFL